MPSNQQLVTLLMALLMALLILISNSVQAQSPDSVDTGWQMKSRMGLQLQQSNYSRSWAGDEVGTISWAWSWNSEAGKQIAPWANFLNTLVTQFGQTHQQNADRSGWEKPRKSADKITYRSLLRFTTGGLLEPFIAFDLDTQFYGELDNLGVKKTAAFTPSIFRLSVGIARTVHESESRRVITRLGLAGKTSVERLAFDTTTLEVSTQRSTEAGLEWFTTGRWVTPKEKTLFESELRFFKAFATSEEHNASRDHWAQIDIDWQNTLSSRVNSFIEFVLFWQILYEAQVDLRGQFKQTLGAGLTWRLK